MYRQVCVQVDDICGNLDEFSEDVIDGIIGGWGPQYYCTNGSRDCPLFFFLRRTEVNEKKKI